MNCSAIWRTEPSGAGDDFRRRLEACLDLHALQDGEMLRMHQLFAAFLRDTTELGELAPALQRVALAQAARLSALAGELTAHPNRADRAALILTFAPDRCDLARRRRSDVGRGRRDRRPRPL